MDGLLPTDVVQLDYSSAFDTLDHDCLSKKLSDCGPPRVSLKSPSLAQLFNVNVCDIPQSDRLLTIQYADDTTLAMCIRSPDDLAAMQAHLDNLAVWSATNHLCVSHDKCAVMRFSLAKKVQTPHYTLGGLLLPPVQELNILGVSFTPSLDFSCHVAKVVSRSRRVLGLESRFSRRFGRETLKTLYMALVLPRLEYCSSIWSPHQINLTERLESVQRRATQTLACHDHSSDYNERPRSLGWRRLSHRRTVAHVRLRSDSLLLPLAGSYLASVPRTSSRTGCPIPLHARTHRHEAFVPRRGELKPVLTRAHAPAPNGDWERTPRLQQDCVACPPSPITLCTYHFFLPFICIFIIISPVNTQPRRQPSLGCTGFCLLAASGTRLCGNCAIKHLEPCHFKPPTGE
ncbi:uncharacterized protein ISCGN_012839 [Ixodes scapularis]